MATEFIGVDCGRKHVKVATKDRTFTFPSKVGDWRQVRIGDPGNYTFVLDGHKYFIGEAAEESYSIREMAVKSKITEETKILFLAALTLARPGPDAVIATGVPVEQHDAVTKDALRRLLCGTHRAAVNGEAEHVLAVHDIVIAPEGAATFWNEALDDSGKFKRHELVGYDRVLTIDVGSRTINYVTLINGRYRDRDSGTLNYGERELLAGGNSPDSTKQFVRRIKGDLAARIPALDDTQLVLLAGGCAPRLIYAMQNQFPAELVSEPFLGNAKGFRKLGMQYAKQTA